jgi:electron transfer flavoprotein alpha subunit
VYETKRERHKQSGAGTVFLICESVAINNLKNFIIMNTYNLFNEKEPSCILFHAIARDKDHVSELAHEAGIDISTLTIELERQNVKDQLGRSYKPKIEDALVR